MGARRLRILGSELGEPNLAAGIAPRVLDQTHERGIVARPHSLIAPGLDEPRHVREDPRRLQLDRPEPAEVDNNQLDAL
eukprot:11191144-Lingulodinium_polyedra.AAC.1